MQESIVLYECQPTWKAEHAENFLHGFSGWLHTDGYQSYHKLPGNIRVVGCWAYARRKFDEMLNTLPQENRKNSPAAMDEWYCSQFFRLEQCPYLIRYLEDGQLELSNNRAERSIKPFVMGRKNWLFANTPRGAQTCAVIYSLIETAKENSFDPYRYLLWVLQTAPQLSEADTAWQRSLPPPIHGICAGCQENKGAKAGRSMTRQPCVLYAPRFDGY